MMMQRLPSEVDQNGNAIPRGFINAEEVEKQLRSRNEIRSILMKNSVQQPALKLLAAPIVGVTPQALPSEDSRDQAERLIEPGATIVRNLAEMQKIGLMNMKPAVMPWADSYWPTFKGGIARRYADKSSPDSKSWGANYQYSVSRPASSIFSTQDQNQINNLSPAEKYDLVMGDMNFTMTRYNWEKGRSKFEEYGAVPAWEGICHGWAPAAHLNQPIPEEAVTVYAPNGVPVTFYPQDVKALTSMLWANNNLESRFVGNRCRVARPQKGPTGKVLDPACFDPNPMTWHVALANQLGIQKRSFNIDSTFDLQVWNFPLAGARYRYFNPRTYEDTTVLNRAVVRVEDYKTDPFKQYRNPKARYVVGIHMDLDHVNAIAPSHKLKRSNPTKTIRLVYDLELDGEFNIIGGEWHSNAHPDFLWTFDATAQAKAREDSIAKEDKWTRDRPVPSNWGELAKKASSRGNIMWSFLNKINGSPEGIDSGSEEETTEPNLP